MKPKENEEEAIKNWDKLMDDFRKTDIYRKSGGVNLFALFYEFLYQNYNAPTKKIK